MSSTLSRLPLPKPPSWLGEFRAFIMRGNVVDLAVAVVIGAAFATIVTAFTAKIIQIGRAHV